MFSSNPLSFFYIPLSQEQVDRPVLSILFIKIQRKLRKKSLARCVSSLSTIRKDEKADSKGALLIVRHSTARASFASVGNLTAPGALSRQKTFFQHSLSSPTTISRSTFVT